jgi:hypothetical protein
MYALWSIVSVFSSTFLYNCFYPEILNYEIFFVLLGKLRAIVRNMEWFISNPLERNTFKYEKFGVKYKRPFKLNVFYYGKFVVEHKEALTWNSPDLTKFRVKHIWMKCKEAWSDT